MSGTPGWVTMRSGSPAAHGDVIKAVLADALRTSTWTMFQRIVVDPCSVSVVRYTSSRPFVLRSNDTGGDLSFLLATAAKPKTRAPQAPGPRTPPSAAAPGLGNVSDRALGCGSALGEISYPVSATRLDGDASSTASYFDRPQPLRCRARSANPATARSSSRWPIDRQPSRQRRRWRSSRCSVLAERLEQMLEPDLGTQAAPRPVPGRRPRLTLDALEPADRGGIPRRARSAWPGIPRTGQA